MHFCTSDQMHIWPYSPPTHKKLSQLSASGAIRKKLHFKNLQKVFLRNAKMCARIAVCVLCAGRLKVSLNCSENAASTCLQLRLS